MPDVLIEEKGNYGIDCRNAVWASDEIHEAYHACGLPGIFCDADFVLERPENGGSRPQKRTKMPILCSKSPKTGVRN